MLTIYHCFYRIGEYSIYGNDYDDGSGSEVSLPSCCRGDPLCYGKTSAGGDVSFRSHFCWLLGLVPIEQVFLGLADSTVVLFGGMFIVGAAMFYTGLAQDIGGQIVKLLVRGKLN